METNALAASLLYFCFKIMGEPCISHPLIVFLIANFLVLYVALMRLGEPQGQREG